MDTKQAEVLTQKYLDGTASPEERAIFESWYNQSVHNSSDPMIEPDYKALQQRLAKSLPAGNKKIYKLWPGIAVAAAAVAAITLGVWLYNIPRHSGEGRNPGSAQYTNNDIAPGKNGATITLANGKVIQLSDAKSGVVVGQDLKYDDGTALSGLQPSLPGGERSMALTASTAKGQTYQFTLPDGTKVWLNADSKLEFPSKFGNVKQRIVRLSGEGYFEVAKDKAHPFIVATDKQEVEVLGTHFNINSYADEGSVRTTLLEGSVRVASLSSPSSRGNERSLVQANSRDLSQGRDDGEGAARSGARQRGEGTTIILKPNQQSVLTNNNRIKVKDVDVSEAVAWIDNKYIFEEETIESIMRTLSRWYDVEVVYEGNVKHKKFSGILVRKEYIAKILDQIAFTEAAHFKIEGRRITVMP